MADQQDAATAGPDDSSRDPLPSSDVGSSGDGSPPASTGHGGGVSTALPRLDESSRWQALAGITAQRQVPHQAPNVAQQEEVPQQQQGQHRENRVQHKQQQQQQQVRAQSPPRIKLGPTTVRGSREIEIPRAQTSTGSAPRMALNSTVKDRPWQDKSVSNATHEQAPQTPRPPTTPTQPIPGTETVSADSDTSSLASSSRASSPASTHANPPIRIPKIAPLSSTPHAMFSHTRAHDTSPQPPPSEQPEQQPQAFAQAPEPVTAQQQPSLVELARGLEGMYVDEFANVLGWDGRVLGRVAGDLPAMVGRPVTASGEVYDPDGNRAGYVVENDMLADSVPESRPLDSLAGQGLQVDHLGNILDANGRMIGHLNGAKEREARGDETCTKSNEEVLQPPSSRPSAPNPSEIYLDVKSTMDGIQIILKIPTVFGREGRPPQVHIS